MSLPLRAYRCPGCQRVQRLAARAPQVRRWCHTCQASRQWNRVSTLTAGEPWPPEPRRVLHSV